MITLSLKILQMTLDGFEVRFTHRLGRLLVAINKVVGDKHWAYQDFIEDVDDHIIIETLNQAIHKFERDSNAP